MPPADRRVRLARGTWVLLAAVLCGIRIPEAASDQTAAAQTAAAPAAAAPAADTYLPRPTGLSAAELGLLTADADTLRRQIDELKKKYPGGAMHDRIADVEVYWAGVHNQLAQNLKTDLGRAQRALQVGAERAVQLARGQMPWMTENGVRGFYSRIDGSPQPYVLNVPVQFNAGDARKYRLDIFLHGRENGSFELNFLGKSTTSFTNMPLNPGPDRFILQPYGRYSNANRFAGETDVLEAIASVKKAYAIDDNRVVMTGFSMGGAAAWQFAVHYADRWAASSAGAGFTETEAYLKLAAAMPPPHEQTLWHMYDSKDFAVNTFNSPTVAYSGEIDPQKQAADVMDAAIAAEGLTLERMIGPNTGHSYEPATRLKLAARLDELAAKGRDPAPREIRFTTWTLRYHTMYWLDVDSLEKHWERARVNAKVTADTVTMTTSNVAALHLNWAAGLAPFAAGARARLTIDNASIDLPPVGADRSLRVGLVKTAGRWSIGELPAGTLHKTPGLQGPIDDAFMDAFLMVRPTGKPLSDALGKWEIAQLEYAVSEWQGVFRGEPRLKADTDVTAADVAAYNLVLFGDPSSNAVYKRIAGRLPITWNANGVTAGDAHFTAGVHAPVMVFPNPLNPKKYVVINSGFTFHDPSSNARQSPKLPDWAVVNITEPGTKALPVSVKAQGFFDESWKLPRR